MARHVRILCNFSWVHTSFSFLFLIIVEVLLAQLKNSIMATLISQLSMLPEPNLTNSLAGRAVFIMLSETQRLDSVM